jgi:hypothetical protein
VAQGGVVALVAPMYPLAIEAGRVEGVPHYLLVTPESVLPGGALRTLTNLEVGDRVYAMYGDRDRLIKRATRIVGDACRNLPDPQAVAGALVVWCLGCKKTIGDDVAAVSEAVAQDLGAAPFITCFTFGEQGYLVNRNVHGNMMISAVVFGC